MLNKYDYNRQSKRYLIAGASVIVPDWEFRDRFWHLEVKVWLQLIHQKAELTDSRVLVLDLSPSPDPSIQM